MSSEKSYDDQFNDVAFRMMHKNSTNLVRPKMWAASTSKMQRQTKNNEYVSTPTKLLERDHLDHYHPGSGSGCGSKKQKLFMWSDKA